MANRLETTVERWVFNSRWLLAPFFIGLLLAIALLLAKFVQAFWRLFYGVVTHSLSDNDMIIDILTLVDGSLIAVLLLIIAFSGYENFVSKIDPGGHPDWPDWMTKVGFGGLKQKLLASIVAISAIQVLKAFMNIDTAFDTQKLAWLVGVHLAFVVSAFMLAIGDRYAGGDHGGE